MKIIDRLPISEIGGKVPTPDGEEVIRPYQMIVRVSLAAEKLHVADPQATTIPAILDTGNNHNLAIRREHWERWFGWLPRRIGQIQVGGFLVPHFAASVWIHPNRAGTAELDGGEPFPIAMEQGIAIYPANVSNPARLPILGLRGLIRNPLRLTIDGEGRNMTLESPAA